MMILASEHWTRRSLGSSSAARLKSSISTTFHCRNDKQQKETESGHKTVAQKKVLGHSVVIFFSKSKNIKKQECNLYAVCWSSSSSWGMISKLLLKAHLTGQPHPRTHLGRPEDGRARCCQIPQWVCWRPKAMLDKETHPTNHPIFLGEGSVPSILVSWGLGGILFANCFVWFCMCDVCVLAKDSLCETCFDFCYSEISTEQLGCFILWTCFAVSFDAWENCQTTLKT